MKYALATLTSMGLRITPENRMAVQNSNLFYLQATSAESNVLNIASSLGRECLVLTKFVKGSPMADLIKRQLRARQHPLRRSGSRAGRPLGLPPSVQHCRLPASACAPRASGMTAPAKSEERFASMVLTIERVFGTEGVGILHLSGLIAAMSHETTECCLALAKLAKQYGHTRLL